MANFLSYQQESVPQDETEQMIVTNPKLSMDGVGHLVNLHRAYKVIFGELDAATSSSTKAARTRLRVNLNTVKTSALALRKLLPPK